MKKSSLLNVALCLTALALSSASSLAQDNREPDLSTNCASLDAGETNKVAMVAFAVGVQIYRWSGSAWVFVAPEAVLYANEDYDGAVAIHYAGPTWESNSGSKRMAVVEYEFKNPPGSGITKDVELRFSRTVPVGDTLSEKGQRLGN